MNTIFYISAFLSIGLVSAMSPKKLSDEDVARLTELANTVASDTKNKIYAPTSLPIGPGCIQHSDCKLTWKCRNIAGALIDIMNHTSHENDVENLKRKAKITGKECIRPIVEVLNAHPKDAVAARIVELLNKLNTIMTNADVDKFQKVYPNASDVLKFSANFEISNAPLVRAADVAVADPLSNLYLLFALRGLDDVSLDAETLILLSLFQTQQPGVNFGSNAFNNPFLLYILLGDNSGSSSDIFLFSLLSQGGLFPTTGIPRQSTVIDPNANSFLYPFILLTLLDGDSGGDDNLLFFFLLSGGLGGTGTGTGLESILPLLLLGDNDLLGGDDNLLLILLLSGGLGGTGTGTGLESILPLLLLSNGSLGGGGDDDNLLLLLLLSGGLGGTGTGTGLESILPLLLLDNNSLLGGEDNLLLLLLLSGGFGGTGVGTGIESILPLLLLSNSSLSGGDDNNLLLLLLFSGGLGGAGTGVGTGLESILPLLLLTNTSGDNNDLLLLLLASGGFGSDLSGTGGLGSLLPLILLDVIDFGGDSDLLTILLLTGGLTGGTDINSLLPLLLISDSGDSDTLLLLFVFGFFQNPTTTNPFGDVYG
ncbi:uncharacterized protein LOC143462866 [Clavelina lepadiformis]|uniref:uncharacterized protein LOC143462866 n=1 Tax=Clavelina lepadiformis TaxID=159417 RepID=UPI004042D013